MFPLLGYNSRTLKEAISVACLSGRAYRKATNIMSVYKDWKIKRQAKNKVNAMLFGQLPGNGYKDKIHRLLSLAENGALSKKELNGKLR